MCILALIILGITTVVFCVEGYEPPRRPVQIEVQLDEEYSAQPSDFVEIFEEPYHYFMNYNSESAEISGDLYGGLVGIGGKLNYSSSYGELSGWGSYDTLTRKRQRIFGQGNFATKLIDKIPIRLGFLGHYGKREYWSSTYARMWLPRYYTTDIFGSIFYPWETGLLAFYGDASGLVHRDFPLFCVIPEEPIPEKYQEFCGSALLRGYKYLSSRYGLYAEGGYFISRRGEDFIPQRGRSAAIGGFFMYAPFVIRAGGAYANTEDGDKIRPAIALRWLKFPYTAEVFYGVGVRTNPAGNHLYDALVYPADLNSVFAYSSYLAPSIVETVGAFLSIKQANWEVSAGGVYGFSSNHPYTYVRENSMFSLVTNPAKIAQAKGEFILNLNPGNTKIINKMLLVADYTKLENGSPMPLVSKHTLYDTLSVMPIDWIEVWVSGEGRSGFYLQEFWYDWRQGYINISTGIKFRWKALTFGLHSANLTAEEIIEPPYYLHSQREYRISVGFENEFMN